MTKKKQRKAGSTGSSSSGEMGVSKPPKDVLGLGRHLVRELGFEDGVDTLGRWMTHHLAELIDEAENGSTPAERLRARKSATETILKIWEHRTSLPSVAYPLAHYKDVLKILNLLRPSDNPFRYFGRDAEAKREQLAAALFDDLSRLIIALLLMKLPRRKASAKVGTAAIKALSKAEQHALKTLQEWGEIFASTAKRSERTRKSKTGGNTKVNLNEAALQLVDSITSTVDELRNELQRDGHRN